MKDIAYILLLGLLVVSASATVMVRGLMSAIVALSVFSIATTVVFAFLQAVDVAMAEAVIGAGLMTALYVAALGRMASAK